MIIHSLIDYYDAQSKLGIMPPVGWSREKISGAMEIDDDGVILAIHDLHNNFMVRTKSGKEKQLSKPSILTVPQIPIRTVNIAPGFLCDNTKYIFGLEPGKTKKFDKNFKAFREFGIRVLEGAAGSAARAMRLFLRRDIRDELSNEIVSKLDTGFYVFRYCGKYLHEDPEIQNIWNENQSSAGEGEKGICAVTGNEDVIVATHPPIKGIPGAQSSGAALVSYNSPSFESYGKTQNLNSEIGRVASLKYTAALNQLLSDETSHSQLGETTVVYWAEGAEKAYQSIMSILLGKESSEMTNEIIDSLYKALESGRLVDADGIDLRKKFYVLGLSPNVARLVVRFFHESTFGELLTNIADHKNRMEIIKPPFVVDESLHPWQILQATASRKTKEKKILPSLPGDLMNSILRNTNYPTTLFTTVIQRIRTDPESFTDPKANPWQKAAILKGYLIKNKKKRSITVSLNEDNNSTPYILGRLFSVLEFLQNDASNGNLNVTIKDKYFGSAAATPGRVFPLLIHNSANHLRKIRSDQKKFTHYDKQVGQLLDRLESNFPKTFSLEEQGEFYLGYYQQRQKQFTKKVKEGGE